MRKTTVVLVAVAMVGLVFVPSSAAGDRCGEVVGLQDSECLPAPAATSDGPSVEVHEHDCAQRHDGFYLEVHVESNALRTPCII